MGSMVSASCKCGYEKDGMFLGGGFANHATDCSFPYYCKECKILFLGNRLDENVFCPDCKKDAVISYDDKRAYKTIGLEVFEWNISINDDEKMKMAVLTDGKYI